MKATSYEEAYARIGGLSDTTKMPGLSWSTPAQKCLTGSKLRNVEGSVCSKCYAMKNFYTFPVVQEALERRYTAVDDPNFEDNFVFVLTTLFNRSRKKETRFRWFDAGDFQNLEHITTVNNIALRVPFMEFWAPTKEAAMVGKWLKANHAFASNLIVRISHPMTEQTFTKAPMGLPFSTVGYPGEGRFNCPASNQGNQCKECRACWSSINVNYHKH